MTTAEPFRARADCGNAGVVGLQNATIWVSVKQDFRTRSLSRPEGRIYINRLGQSSGLDHFR